MSNQVPFTAFCPECKAGRTFTLIGYGFGPNRFVKTGCVVCGTSERDALLGLSARAEDDRDTIGELSARVNTLDGEIAELRDEVLEQDKANVRMFRRLTAKS